ncbi:MAG: 3-methyl-2-oxobutanoate hydroxymethyltransferase [Candidatus Sericytochromatia bacterium]|nr:3-methyl-2-oxobutanoate hydroxymethyltransferase [Candidatus Sericytochromatia bacterium]
MSSQQPLRRRTVREIVKAKGRQPLVMLTAYDAVMAQLLEESGVDMLLVGDSLGNVVLGHETTLPVTMTDMLRHTAAVVRGTRQALIVADMPFLSYQVSADEALRHAGALMAEAGAGAVKLEGGAELAPTVNRLVSAGIPVMGHIGLQPQSVNVTGYASRGKTDADAERLQDDALALAAAGCFALVLECVVPAVAARISQALTIPTIGIGSGEACDGQVLVINDLIGLSVRTPPSFVTPRADVASLIRQTVAGYVHDVKASLTAVGS